MLPEQILVSLKKKLHVQVGDYFCYFHSVSDVSDMSSFSPVPHTPRTSLQQWLQGHIGTMNGHYLFSHFVPESFGLDLVTVTKLLIFSLFMLFLLIMFFIAVFVLV